MPSFKTSPSIQYHRVCLKGIAGLALLIMCGGPFSAWSEEDSKSSVRHLMTEVQHDIESGSVNEALQKLLRITTPGNDSYCQMDSANLDAALTVLSTLYELQGDHAAAEATLIRTAAGTTLATPAGVYQNVLRRWYLKMRQGKTAEARDLLTATLRTAEGENTLCGTDFVRFLLGSISFQSFLDLKAQNSGWCRSPQFFSPALAHFYRAAAISMAGSEAEGKAEYRIFLQGALPTDQWEQRVARQQVPDFSAPSPMNSDRLSAKTCGK